MKFLNSPLAKDALINTLGTVISALFGLVFFILVSRSLGPYLFGIFAAAQVLQIVFSDIFDLGTNTGILRFVPKFLAQRSTLGSLLKIALEIKVIIGLIIFLIGLYLSEILATLIFSDESISSSVMLAFLILPTLLVGFSVSYLQARKEFLKSTLLLALTNIFRLGVLIFFMVNLPISIFSAMAIFVSTPLFGFLISPFFFKVDFILKAESRWHLAKEFLSFNKWITFAFSTAAIQNRIDNLFLIRFATPFQAGLYAASSRLLSVYPLISGALSTAFAPSFAANLRTGDKKQIFKATMIQTLILGILSLFPIIFAGALIDLIYGKEFASSVKIFQILNLAMFFVIASVPSITAIIYLFSKPQYYFLLTVIQLIITIVGDILLIPKFGGEGASLIFLLGTFALYLISLAYSLSRFRKIQ